MPKILQENFGFNQIQVFLKLCMYVIVKLTLNIFMADVQYPKAKNHSKYLTAHTTIRLAN